MYVCMHIYIFTIYILTSGNNPDKFFHFANLGI